MPRYAAFLRAVNLGKNRRVSGAELCAVFEAAGLEEVSAFRTSGNLAFAGEGSRARLQASIEESLEAELGYAVPTFLRSEEEMRALAGQEPFPASVVEGSAGKLQVVLLPKKPAAAAQKKVLAYGSDEDRLAFGDKELFWLPRAGTQQSQLDTGQLRDLVGLSTVRTMGTIQAMTAKFFAG